MKGKLLPGKLLFSLSIGRERARARKREIETNSACMYAHLCAPPPPPLHLCPSPFLSPPPPCPRICPCAGLHACLNTCLSVTQTNTPYNPPPPHTHTHTHTYTHTHSPQTAPLTHRARSLARTDFRMHTIMVAGSKTPHGRFAIMM